VNAEKAISVLVVEDDTTHSKLVEHCLSKSDVLFHLTFAQSCTEAKTMLSAGGYDCVVLDHNLPDGTGDELMENARYQLLRTPVVAYSTSLDRDVIVSELRGGCVDFIPKRDAFTGDNLVQTILSAIDRHAVRAAVERAGSSAELIERAERLLQFDGDQPTRESPSIIERLQTIYETAIRTIQDGVALIERRSRVVFVNPGLKKLLRLSDLVNLPGNPLTTVDDILARDAAEAFKNRPTARARYESVLRTADGRDVPVMIGETPLGPHGTLLAISDLSEVKQQQNELEKKNTRLAELNAMATRFVDNVSHEFRTPLTVIKGYSEILEQGLAGPISNQQREYLRTVLDRTRDLTQMVDDLLDTSKLRAGCLRVDRVALRVDDVFAPLKSAIEHKAQANKITVHKAFDPDLPLFYGDAEKIGRVVLNLVVNAMKFSDEGSAITIWGRRRDQDQVEFGVTDQGPGISKENLALIFDRFKQVGDPQRSSTKGFGLGLNIANELVSMNLGSMHVQSELGKGSTFSFTVPCFDTRAILACYIKHDPRPAAGRGPLALLEVQPDASDSGGREEMRIFLASHTFPMDLVFEGKSGDLWFLVGFSTSPRKWSDRLRCMRNKQLKENGASVSNAATFTQRAEWDAPITPDFVKQLIQHLETGGVTCRHEH